MELAASAIQREVYEEIGVSHISILKESNAWFSYDFPANLSGAIAKKYKGQSQKWFLCALQEEKPDLEKAVDKEFCALDWWPVDRILAEIVDFKKPVYEAALKDLGLLQ